MDFRYPYTDFHELNLDWFLLQFKELKDNWDSVLEDNTEFKNTLEQEMGDLQHNFDTLDGTVQTFTLFVTNYFDNLDVQTEINNKLNAMAADGTLEQLLQPYVNTLIPAAVTEWLNINCNPVGSAVTIDVSLTTSGSAADAKITGQLRDGFNATLTPVTFAPALTADSYIKQDGTGVGSSNKYCRMTSLAAGHGHIVRIDMTSSAYEMQITYYDATGVITTGTGFLGYDGYLTGPHYVIEDAVYFACNFRRADQATLSATDRTNILAALKAYSATDTTLSVDGAAADAAVTGTVRQAVLDLGGRRSVNTANWATGGLKTNMSATDTSSYRARIVPASMPQLTADMYTSKIVIRCDPKYLIRVGTYNSAAVSSLDTVITAPTSSFTSGDIEIPLTAVGKYLNFDVKKADGTTIDASDLTDLETGVIIVTEESTGDLARLQTQHKSTAVDAINDNAAFIANTQWFDITPTNNIDWVIDHLIAYSDGSYSSNSSYPYLFCCSNFIPCSPAEPLRINMGTDDYSYRVYFYSSNSQSSYVSCDGAYIKGGTTTVYDGYWFGTQYNYVRINIVRADHAYSSADFAQCVAAFHVESPYPYGFRKTATSYYNHFTVQINLDWPNTSATSSSNAESLTSADIKCVLALPVAYSASAEPVPVIMLAHGRPGYITDTVWYASGNTKFNNLVSSLLSAGFAIFDVDNTRSDAAGWPDWGCLPLMSAYRKAWDYIRQNYNVQKQLMIYAFDMGTPVALNFATWWKDEVKAMINAGPRPVVKAEYESLSAGTEKTQMEEAFGLSAGTWDDTRLRGFCHYENLIDISGTNYAPVKLPPVKVLVGKSDSTFLTETRAYYNALGNAGNFVNYREVTGFSHDDAQFMNSSGLRTEAVRWFERFK